MPTTGDASFAPFVPRSTPKSGEFGRALSPTSQDRPQRVADPLLLRLLQAQPHRQPDQALRQRGRQRKIAMRASEALARRRGMQRDIVETAAMPSS